MLHISSLPALGYLKVLRKLYSQSTVFRHPMARMQQLWSRFVTSTAGHCTQGCDLAKPGYMVRGLFPVMPTLNIKGVGLSDTVTPAKTAGNQGKVYLFCSMISHHEQKFRQILVLRKNGLNIANIEPTCTAAAAVECPCHLQKGQEAASLALQAPAPSEGCLLLSLCRPLHPVKLSTFSTSSAPSAPTSGHEQSFKQYRQQHLNIYTYINNTACICF